MVITSGAAGVALIPVVFGTANLLGLAVRYLAPYVYNDGGVEARINLPWKVAGHFDRMRVILENAPGAGEWRIFTLRINGVNTLLVVTIANLVVQGDDNVNIVAVAENDLVSIEHTHSVAPANTRCKGAFRFQ